MAKRRNPLSEIQDSDESLGIAKMPEWPTAPDVSEYIKNPSDFGDLTLLAIIASGLASNNLVMSDRAEDPAKIARLAQRILDEIRASV